MKPKRSLEYDDGPHRHDGSSARGAGSFPFLGSGATRTAAFFVAFYALATRRPDQLFLSQFYAEDGTVYFLDALEKGGRALWHPYHGYLHLVPRMVAGLVGAVVPWEWLPTVYAIAGAAVTAWVAVRFLSARLPGAVCVIGAVAVVAVPHSGEVFLNLCCLHFILAMVIIVNLLEPPPASRLESVRRGAEMGLAALTGPEAIILLPAALFRGWQWRRRPKAVLAISVLVVATTVQTAIMIATRARPTVPVEVLLKTGVEVVPHYVQGFFFGWTMAGFTWVAGWVETGFVALVMAVIFWEPANASRARSALCLLGAALFLGAGRVSAPGWANPLGDGARYTYLPFVLGFLAIGWLLAGSQRRSTRVLTMSLVVAILASTAVHWVGRFPPNYHWRQQVAEFRTGRLIRFVEPPGWVFEIPRRPAP